MNRLLRRLTSDLLRIYVTAFVALVGAVLGFLPAALELNAGLAPGESLLRALFSELLIPFYLVIWVAGSLLYIAITHWVYTRLPQEEARRIASGQREHFTWWEQMLGASGAASLSIQAATMSAALTLLISQTDQYKGSVWIIVLGLASVAGSWAMMVYSYALHYFRLWAAGEPIEVDADEPSFDDFLTISILTATLHGSDTKWRSGTARRSLRTQVLLAFVFNTVVIAMTVSLILS